MKFSLAPTLAASTIASTCFASSHCVPESFQAPTGYGVDFLDIATNEVLNYTRFSLAPGTSDAGSYTVNFCNVTLTYSHSGWNDRVNVNIWLPLQVWNGRVWALGGGGYSASFGSIYLAQAVAKGFAAISTDSGHVASMESSTSLDWALASPGNLNLELLEDWGHKTLGELATFGKAITKQYYGRMPSFSYFSGCSGGGRQAMVLAQRFPHAFDGILAVAPAMNIEAFIPAAYWATQIMKALDYYPSPCEIDAFTKKAVEACDSLDGVEDGIISTLKHCHFRAQDVVGKEFVCNGTTGHLSSAGAKVVQAAWDGPQSPAGEIIWPGLNMGASLTTTYVTTDCNSNGTCYASSTALLGSWYQYLLAKDPDYNTSSMTMEDFYAFLKSSNRDFSSSLGSSDPDLSSFAEAGGKLISWHGMADEAIPTRQSAAYYDRVLEKDPNARDYYRYFEAPGVGHCYGGVGPMPNGAFDQLMAWTENSTVPEVLYAGSGNSTRPLCPYPLVQTFVGNNTDGGLQFACTTEQYRDGKDDRRLSF